MSNPESFQPNAKEALVPAETPEQHRARIEAHKLYELSEPLFHAAKMGDKAEIERLVQAGADVGVCDRVGKMTGAAPLHYAAAEGHLSAVQTLLALGADPNARDFIDRTPIHVASARGQVGAIRALAAKGADLAAKCHSGETALDWAKMAQKPEAIRLLEELEASQTH